MKSDERIGVQPMPADAVPAVDQDHADVRMTDQGVGERHPHRTRADHHVIGFQHRLRHRPMLTARRSPNAGQPDIGVGVHPGALASTGARPRVWRNGASRTANRTIATPVALSRYQGHGPSSDSREGFSGGAARYM